MNRVSYLSPVRISLPAPCLLGHLVSLGSLRCLRRVKRTKIMNGGP